MTSPAAETSSFVEADAPLAGVEYLDAWRAAVRPFPGSVPPVAGFDTIDEVDPAGDTGIASMVSDAVEAIAALHSIDSFTAEPRLLDQIVAGVEQLRRMTDAAATDVTAIVDDRNPFRSQGYMKFLLRRCRHVLVLC